MAEPTVSVKNFGSWHVVRAFDVEWSETETGCETAAFTMVDRTELHRIRDDSLVRITSPTGRLLWTGHVKGDGLRDDGQREMRVECRGNKERVYQRHFSLPFVVQGFDGWVRDRMDRKSDPFMKTEVSSRPQDPPYDALVIQHEKPHTADLGTRGRMVNTTFIGTDMNVGAMKLTRDCGDMSGIDPSTCAAANPQNWRLRWYVGHSSSGAVVFESDMSVTAPTEIARSTINPEWTFVSPAERPNNYLAVEMEYPHSYPSEQQSEQCWTSWMDSWVAGERVTKYGVPAPLTSSTDAATVITASDVANHLIGACLDMVPAQDSYIAETTMNLAPLDYRDPLATPGAILDDLTTFHMDYTWRALKAEQDGTFGIRFEPKPKTPRYRISRHAATLDMAPASEALANRVVVTYVDWRGNRQQVERVASKVDYPDTEDMSGTIDAEVIDHGSDATSRSLAGSIAEQVRDVVARRRSGGTATVTGLVTDIETGDVITPDLIEAGELALVEGTGGVHWVSEVSHDGLGAATLTLDSPRRTVEQIVALAGRRKRKG